MRCIEGENDSAVTASLDNFSIASVKHEPGNPGLNALLRNDRIRVLKKYQNVLICRPLFYQSSLRCLSKTIHDEGLLAVYKGFFPAW